MNLPQAFVHRMQQQLGHEADEFFASLNTPSPTSIRLHHSKGAAPYELNDPVLWCDDGYYLAQRPSFHLDPHWHGGAYYVQEASSMILDEVIKQLPLQDESKIWLDLCAAPGGKTGILARHMDPGDILIANELIPQRRTILYENLVKGGYPDTFITGERSDAFPQDFADVILLDAPCSGEGMMRKDPEAVRQWTENLVNSCAILQKQIIEDGIRVLKPGGWLIYSTCSYSPDENIMNALLVASNDKMRNHIINFPGHWNIIEVIQHNIAGYQLYPHRVRGEGLFISVFQKKEEDLNVKSKKGKSKSYFLPLPGALIDKVDQPAQWVHETIDNSIFLLNQKAIATASEVRMLLPKARLIAEAGEIKGKDFVPHHYLAMAGVARQSFPGIHLDKEQALDFLEKKTIHPGEFSNNWYLPYYENTTLGWAKQTVQGLKNYYPMNWRLRQRKETKS